MEDATQPGMVNSQPFQYQTQETQAYDSQFTATQLEIDPRRIGDTTGGMSPEDLADIFCTLHPSTPAAYHVATNLAQATPELTASKDANDTDLPPHESFEGQEGMTSRVIALRLSAALKDPLEGYCFGRNPRRCDIVISHLDSMKRISNVHFKIYMNKYGSIMLEDSSTNGTSYDGIHLKSKNKPDGQWRHTIQHGGVIEIPLPPDGDLKFIVRIPRREGEYEDAFNKNCIAHLKHKHELQLEREERARVRGDLGELQPVNLFPQAMQPRDEDSAPVEVSIHAKEWKGGSKYNKVKVIGKGAFATVFLLTAKFDGTPFAAKEIEKRRFIKNGMMDMKIETEMRIMRQIDHEYIVKFIEDIDWESHLYIIMEYVPLGDLGAIISKQKYMPEPFAKTMATQMLSALQYLHGIGITHRDIKPDNILIQSFEPLVVKLTDFGLSKVIDDSDTFLRTFCGTLLYCAPEVYTEYREYDVSGVRRHGRDKSTLPPQKYNSSIDLWSLAGVLFYTLSGCPPYPAPSGTTYRELLHSIMTKPLEIWPLQSREVGDNCIRFLRSMLQVRPEHRPSIEELQDSAWLNGDEIENSDDEDGDVDYDEVDMIGDNTGAEDIEKGASQLSISQVEDSDDDASQTPIIPSDPFPHIKNKKHREVRKEIPSSFVDYDSSVNESANESYGFMKTAPGNDRLFGEVNSSAVGSSGILPNHLNLPQTTFGGVNNTNMTREGTEILEETAFGASTGQQVDGQSPCGYSAPYHQRADSNATATPFRPEYGWRLPNTTSSLHGAVSHLGQLRMESPDPITLPTHNTRPTMNQPSRNNQDTLNMMAANRRYVPATSPPVTSPPALSSTNTTPPAMSHGSMSPPLPPTRRQSISTNIPNFNSSVRRREDTEEISDSERAAKRPRSSRHIQISVPKSTYWDPKDKSTHHQNYPRLSFGEWTARTKEARARGEDRYIPEKRDWLALEAEEERLATEQATREPSNDPGTPSTQLGYGDDYSTVRGTSVESTARGRTPLMRDERRLSEDEENVDPYLDDEPLLSLSRQGSLQNLRSSSVPATTANFPTNNTASSMMHTHPAPTHEDILQSAPVGVTIYDFNASFTIYGKFTTIPESIIKDITFPINSRIMSYGRSNDSIVKHSNSYETKIPRHAFKLVAWRPNIAGPQPESVEADMAFYISSKSKHGIRVNGHRIPIFMENEIHGACRHWAELKNGDFITIWLGDDGAVTLKFNCWFGKSAENRGEKPLTFLHESLAPDLDAWLVERESKRLVDKTETATRETKEANVKPKTNAEAGKKTEKKKA